MDGIHAHLAGLPFEKGAGMPAKAAASVSGVDIQFVDESVMAMELKAESQCQDNVSDVLVRLAEKPNSAECREGREFTKGGAGRRLVKFDLSRFLFGEGAHHAQQLRFVREGRFTNHKWGHVTHQFVRSVSRRDRSSRSDGWRRSRPHCRHESIRKRE